MPHFRVLAPNEAEISKILQLQAQNHIAALPDEARGDGFVTTRLDRADMVELRRQNGLVVARTDSGDLAGYACAHVWDFSAAHPFQLAVDALLPLPFENATLSATNSFQYGPVCVARPFRGQGALDPLFEATKANFRARFPFGLTFIDVRNGRSLSAHERKLGFHRLTRLTFGDATYHVLGFSTR